MKWLVLKVCTVKCKSQHIYNFGIIVFLSGAIKGTNKIKYAVNKYNKGKETYFTKTIPTIRKNTWSIADSSMN